ncbi:MAG: S41 family peptidase [bacterium]
MKKKWIKHIKIILCVFVICTIALYGAWRIWLDPYRGTVGAFEQSEKLDTILTGMQAAEDLEFIVSHLQERHPACISDLPAAVRKAYEREYAELFESTEVTVLSLWQSASRVLACLGDAHTTVRAYYKDTKFLPLLFSWKGQRLICSGGEYDNYVVNKIGDVAVAQLYERFQEQFSYELDAWARHAFASRINRSDYLAFVGIDIGREVEISLKRQNDGSLVNKAFALQENEIAMPVETETFYDYSVDGASGIGIFTLRQCIYDKTYKTALKDFFISVQDEGVHSVIVDLRGNPGGNSLVANEFLRYLPVESYQVGSSAVRFGPVIWENQPGRQKNQQAEYVFSGDVYVLTSTDSFSAAMDFATLLSDNGLCTVVGEIPGNMPSSYGDVLYFQTPNALLAFTVSYKYFMRPDESKSNLPLLPDVQISANDALEEALRLIHND